MKLKLLTNINTTTDLETLRQQLLDLEGALFHGKRLNKEYLAEFFTQENYDLLLRDLKENEVAISDAKALNTFINNILEYVNTIPKVHFVFAVQPVKKTLNKIAKYISTVDKKYIISFSVDPDIYGGAVIMKDGKTYDYSVLKKVENVILEKNFS